METRRDTEVSPGFNANAEIAYRRESTEFSLTASQALEPSSLGELQTRINFGFSASQRINERSTLRLMRPTQARHRPARLMKTIPTACCFPSRPDIRIN